MIHTTERLALALEELNDPSLAEMIENARLGATMIILLNHLLP